MFEKVVNFTLPCCAILQTYGWEKFNFSFLITLCLIVWGIIIKKRTFSKLPKLLSVYLWYSLIIILISFTSLSDLIPLGWLRVFLTYSLFFAIVDLPLLEKYYSKIGVVCIAFYFVQYFVSKVYGIYIPGVTQSLPLALDVSDENAYFEHLTSSNVRVSSFFSEPAQFAQFLMPLLILKLYKKTKKSKKNILYVVAILACLLLMKSGNALFGVGVIMVCYAFWLIRYASSVKKVLLILLIPVIAIGGTAYYFGTETGQELLERQDQLSDDANASSGLSGFIRIFRGYYVYDELSPIQKIIGANNPVVIKDIISKSKVAFLFRENDFSFNTVQNSLIRTGLVGTLILFIFYLSLFRKGNIVGKTTIVTFFVLGFISAHYLTTTMLLYLVISDKSRKQTKLISHDVKTNIVNYYPCRQ